MTPPAEHYRIRGPGVLISDHICAILSRYALNPLRARRGSNPELDAAIASIDAAGEQWRTARNAAQKVPSNGTKVATASEPAEPLLLTTQQAADRLHCSTRAITKALAAGRVQGTKIDGKWHIAFEEFERYRTGRKP